MVAVYVVVHYLHDDPAFALEVIVIPMLVIILVELLHGKYVTTLEQREEIRAEIDRLRAQVEKVADCVSSGEIAPRLMVKVLGRASAQVSAAEIDEVWQMFGNARSKAIIATQRAKMLAEGVAVSKVFIVNEENEINSAEAKETLQLHRGEGITDLYYIVKGDIKTRLGDKFTVAEDDIDFAMFDDKVVLCWRFDHQRHIKGGRVFFGENEVKPFREFSSQLKAVAKKCP